MSSEPRSKRSVLRSPFGIGILSVLLIAGFVVALVGCKPKPTESVLPGRTNMPRDVVAVFFSKYQGNQSIVENVVRRLPPDARSNPLQFALAELLKGPTNEEKSQGFYSEIPKGTKLLALRKDKDTVTVNLSKDFTTGGGSTSMIQRVEELKQTVFSNESNHNINVTIEGKPLEVLGGEGLEVPETLQRQSQ